MLAWMLDYFLTESGGDQPSVTLVFPAFATDLWHVWEATAEIKRPVPVPPAIYMIL